MNDPESTLSAPTLADAVVALDADVRAELDASVLRLVHEESRDPARAARRFRAGLEWLRAGPQASPLIAAAVAEVTETGRHEVAGLASRRDRAAPRPVVAAIVSDARRHAPSFESAVVAHNRVTATRELRDLLADPRDDPNTRLVRDAARARIQSAAADRAANEARTAADAYRWPQWTKDSMIAGALGIVAGFGIGVVGLLTMLNPVPGLGIMAGSTALTVGAATTGVVDGARQKRTAERAGRQARAALSTSLTADAALFELEPPRPAQSPPGASGHPYRRR